MNNLLIATSNPHKMRKIFYIFSNTKLNIIKLSNKNIKAYKNHEEIGSSFKMIAEQKALFLSRLNPDAFVVATDGGMDIPSLGTTWDKLHTKRFIGKNDITDFQRMDALLDLMKNKIDRRMIWNEALAIAKNNKIIFSNEVTGAEGIMQESYSKSQYQLGIWLCSLWYFPKFKKNFFKLNNKEKKHAEISWEKLRSNVNIFIKNNLPHIITN